MRHKFAPFFASWDTQVQTTPNPSQLHDPGTCLDSSKLCVGLDQSSPQLSRGSVPAGKHTECEGFGSNGIKYSVEYLVILV